MKEDLDYDVINILKTSIRDLWEIKTGKIHISQPPMELLDERIAHEEVVLSRYKKRMKGLKYE